jgi:diguanylate cyclase (GGDEF)-like protein
VIDIQTLILALGIGNIGFAALMAGYTHGAAPNPGLKLFIWSRVVMGASQLLGWLRPSPWLVDMDAFGAMAGAALEVTSYAVFFGAVRWSRVLVPMTILGFLLMLFAQLRGVSHIQLLALSCAVLSVFAGLSAYILLRPLPRGTSLLQRIVGVNDAMFAVAMAAGAVDGFRHPLVALGESPWHAYAGICGYVLMIVNGFGFLLLCKQKDDDQLAFLATTDSLTGLANRRAFFERAESARLLALRMRAPISLMMIDIDHFKQINDRFGHARGDEALSLFAETARATLREHDIMGRLGGEEFALLLPGTDLDGALQAAERLRLEVTAARMIDGDAAHTMTVSIGVVLIDPKEELTAALARADHALYAAKKGGRDRVEVGAPMLRRA